MVQNHLNALRRDDITQAAVVILDNATGAVRALIGSRDFAVGEGQINGALQYRPTLGAEKVQDAGFVLE